MVVLEAGVPGKQVDSEMEISVQESDQGVLWGSIPMEGRCGIRQRRKWAATKSQ